MAVRSKLTTSAARSEEQFLSELKEVKNALIGNVCKKIELVEEAGAMQYMVEELLSVSKALHAVSSIDKAFERQFLLKLEILNELAVIICAVANAGNAALVTLLKANLAIMLLVSISIVAPRAKSTTDSHPRICRYIISKCLPSLARALRNHTIALGDFVWGHMWGVGVDVKIDGIEAKDTESLLITGEKNGSSSMDVDQVKVNESSGSSAEDIQVQAAGVLTGLFQSRSLQIYSPILLEPSIPLTTLPLFQMLAHLTVMPWQRKALVNGEQAESSSDTTAEKKNAETRPLIKRLVEIVTAEDSNVKLKKSALDFLAALCKDDEEISTEALSALGAKVDNAQPWNHLPVLDQLADTRAPGIAVSTLCCVATMTYSIPPDSSNPMRHLRTSSKLMNHLIVALDQPIEDKIRLCFVLSHSIADDVELQDSAMGAGAMAKIISIVMSLQTDATKDQPENLRARLLEACFLAMTSLALCHEPARSSISDAGMLRIIKGALSHESYGVRAAACQVTRALSRSIAIMRTTLMDSGIADRILELLGQEEKRFSQSAENENDFPDIRGNGRRDTVMAAGTATLCNLITEFSPMQLNVIDKGGIDLLVRLCEFPSPATRTNALWALRNMLYKNDLSMKTRVMEALTWPTLQRYIDGPSAELREQGLALLRNICSEGSEEEIELVFQGFGEGPLFDVIERQLPTTDQDCLEQLMYVLYNICLGSERHRDAVLSRPEVCKGMIKALTIDNPLVKIPAIGCFANLIETNDRHRRPRQDVVSRLKPYMLETQLKSMITDPTFDIRDKASRLLKGLEPPGNVSR